MCWDISSAQPWSAAATGMWIVHLLFLVLLTEGGESPGWGSAVDQHLTKSGNPGMTGVEEASKLIQFHLLP